MDENQGGGGGAASEALALLAAGLDALAAVGPWRASDAEVAEVLVATEVFARRLSGVQLAVIAEGVARGLPYAAGSGSSPTAPATWVRSLIAITPHDAKQRAALAADLFTGPKATWHRPGTPCSPGR